MDQTAGTRDQTWGGIATRSRRPMRIHALARNGLGQSIHEPPGGRSSTFVLGNLAANSSNFLRFQFCSVKIAIHVLPINQIFKP